MLEKHADFFRDFRGDTVHPSTMQIMSELGLLDDFLKLPFQRTQITSDGDFGGTMFRMADFRRLKTQCPFIALMPQWDFLDFLADKARFPDLAGDAEHRRNRLAESRRACPRRGGA